MENYPLTSNNLFRLNIQLVALEVTTKIIYFRIKKFFKKTLFSSIFIEWRKFDPDTQAASSQGKFQNNILKLIMQCTNSVSNRNIYKGN